MITKTYQKADNFEPEKERKEEAFGLKSTSMESGGRGLSIACVGGTPGDVQMIFCTPRLHWCSKQLCSTYNYKETPAFANCQESDTAASIVVHVLYSQKRVREAGVYWLEMTHNRGGHRSINRLFQGHQNNNVRAKTLHPISRRRGGNLTSKCLMMPKFHIKSKPACRALDSYLRIHVPKRPTIRP